MSTERFIKYGSAAMAARHSGVVSHIDTQDNFGEITMEGHAPVACSLAELRRIGAAAIGCRVDFEFGTVGNVGGGFGNTSGAVKLTRPGSVP
jgi:hypothetical protein